VSSTMRLRSVTLAAFLCCSYIACIMLRTYFIVRSYNRKSYKNYCFVVILLPYYNKNFYIVKVKAEIFCLLIVIANSYCYNILLLSSMSLTRLTPLHYTLYNNTTHTYCTLLTL
jgi:hypothetical protein